MLSPFLLEANCKVNCSSKLIKIIESISTKQHWKSWRPANQYSDGIYVTYLSRILAPSSVSRRTYWHGRSRCRRIRGTNSRRQRQWLNASAVCWRPHRITAAAVVVRRPASGRSSRQAVPPGGRDAASGVRQFTSGWSVPTVVVEGIQRPLQLKMRCQRRYRPIGGSWASCGTPTIEDCTSGSGTVCWTNRGCWGVRSTIMVFWKVIYASWK